MAARIPSRYHEIGSPRSRSQPSGREQGADPLPNSKVHPPRAPLIRSRARRIGSRHATGRWHQRHLTLTHEHSLVLGEDFPGVRRRSPDATRHVVDFLKPWRGSLDGYGIPAPEYSEPVPRVGVVLTMPGSAGRTATWLLAYLFRTFRKVDDFEEGSRENRSGQIESPSPVRRQWTATTAEAQRRAWTNAPPMSGQDQAE